MDVLKASLVLAITPLITAVLLREAISFLLRARTTFQDALILAMGMVLASLVLHYGVGHVIERATQDPGSLGLATLVLWTGDVAAHLAILVYRLDVTVLNALRVYVLMIVGLLAVGFALVTAFFVMSWLWMDAVTPVHRSPDA